MQQVTAVIVCCSCQRQLAAALCMQQAAAWLRMHASWSKAQPSNRHEHATSSNCLEHAHTYAVLPSFAGHSQFLTNCLPTPPSHAFDRSPAQPSPPHAHASANPAADCSTTTAPLQYPHAYCRASSSSCSGLPPPAAQRAALMPQRQQHTC